MAKRESIAKDFQIFAPPLDLFKREWRNPQSPVVHCPANTPPLDLFKREWRNEQPKGRIIYLYSRL